MREEKYDLNYLADDGCPIMASEQTLDEEIRSLEYQCGMMETCHGVETLRHDPDYKAVVAGLRERLQNAYHRKRKELSYSMWRDQRTYRHQTPPTAKSFVSHNPLKECDTEWLSTPGKRMGQVYLLDDLSNLSEEGGDYWVKVRMELLNKELPVIFGRVISHSREVSKREHVKADRIERVNIFLTDLRRELGRAYAGPEQAEFKKLVIGALCRKEAWFDIGLPNETSVANWGCFTTEKLEAEGAYIAMTEQNVRSWVAQASNTSERTFKDAALNDLRDLEGILKGVDPQLAACKQINKEADGLMDQLTQLYDS